MQRAHGILLIVFLGIAASAATGDLWINCAPGFDIFLDGEFMGVSEPSENGKRLPGVSSGEHTIRIEEDGVALLEFSIPVGPASNQVVVGELGPESNGGLPGAAEGEEAEEQLVGTIEVMSDPRNCTVEFSGRKTPKEQPILTIPGIAVGEHNIRFESEGTVLRTTVVVQADQLIQVRVDFRNKLVSVRGDTSDVRGGESASEEESPRAELECIEYWVQVMRTSNFDEIEPAQSALKDMGYPSYHQKLITIEDESAPPIFKLRVGPIPRRNKAQWVAGLIRHAGFTAVWVVPTECHPR